VIADFKRGQSSSFKASDRRHNQFGARAEFEAQERRKEVTHLTARRDPWESFRARWPHELNQPLTAILSNAQAAQRLLRQ